MALFKHQFVNQNLEGGCNVSLSAIFSPSINTTTILWHWAIGVGPHNKHPLRHNDLSTINLPRPQMCVVYQYCQLVVVDNIKLCRPGPDVFSLGPSEVLCVVLNTQQLLKLYLSKGRSLGK